MNDSQVLSRCYKMAVESLCPEEFEGFMVAYTALVERRDLGDKLKPSEAVYGFAAWLTTRDEKTVLSASDDAAPITDLVAEFCKENNLSDPSDGWASNLIHPSGECSYSSKD